MSRLKTYGVPATGLNAKGVAVVNLLQLHPEEIVTAVIKHDVKEKKGYFFMTTKQGTVKKTKLEDYNNIRTSGLIAIKIDEGDELKWIRPTTGDRARARSLCQGNRLTHETLRRRPLSGAVFT